MTWQKATVAIQEVLDSLKYGYEKSKDDGSMLPKMMNQAPAAPEVMNDLVCNCCPHDCRKLCKCYGNQQLC